MSETETLEPIEAPADVEYDVPDGDMIVSLDEFADLIGLTTEQMRKHLNKLDEETAAGFILERGSHGRAYKILARAGHAWWIAKKEREAEEAKTHADDLAQLRMDLVGGSADDDADYELSGKRRKEEAEAELTLLRLRGAKGELLEREVMVRLLRQVFVDLRKGLTTIPATFAKKHELDAAMRLDLEKLVETRLGALAESFAHLEITGDEEGGRNAA